MTAEDMACELRAAGWEERSQSKRWSPRDVAPHAPVPLEEAWKELAQQRAQGTVTTPVVGEEE